MIGKCHLCNKVKKLSFEHVPPQKAFNNKKVFYYTGEDFLKHISTEDLPWDFSNLKAKQSQKGMGGNTLCIHCNNITGHWYGDAFVQFIVQGYKTVHDRGGFENIKKLKNIDVLFKGIYPHRVVKQIICMFFSINHEDLCHAHSNLASKILNKNGYGVDNHKYTLIPYINTGRLVRNLGITASLNIYTGLVRTVSELTALPFGFILKFDSKEPEPTNMIGWINEYEYDEAVDIDITIPLYEANTPYTMDFRSSHQIIEDRDKNR